MTSKLWYRHAAFDPDAEALPAELDTVLERAPGSLPALLLLAGPDARASGWAGAAAERIAYALASHGHDVCLIDAGIADPRLHQQIGVPNDEGVVDFLLYGASLEHLERPAPDAGVAVIPAGPNVADAEVVLRSRAWLRLLNRFTTQRRTAAVFAPAELPAAADLAGTIGAVLLLASGDEAHELARTIPRDAMFVAALHPPGDVIQAAEPASGTTGETSAPPAGHDVAAVVVPEGGEEPALREPPPPVRKPKKRSTPPALRILLWVVLVAALAWLAWDRFGPGGSQLDAATEAPAGTSVAAATGGPARPTGTPIETPLPYSVAIESHSDVGLAMRRAVSLRSAEPDLGFFVAPILVDSVVYYRVLAGPVADSASAAALLRRLVEEGHKGSADDWSIRPTPWAFLIDELPAREGAVARTESLRRDSVPAYVVEVPYSSGASVYRVYAGAFEGPGLSEVMAGMLRNHGIEPKLVRRTGKPTA